MLTDHQRAILDFEGQWWRMAGNKEAMIRERFDLSPIRYYQLLNQALDQPAAAAEFPTTVARLQRLRTKGGVDA